MPALARRLFNVTILALLSSPVMAASRAELNWRAIAAQDLDAAHALVVAAHPGMIDPENPEFGRWVESGYEEAKGLLPYATTYDTALAVVRYYASGFRDGHLMVSDDMRDHDPIMFSGWFLTRDAGRYVVTSRMPQWNGVLPPAGATWLGCDGRAAEVVLREEVAPFIDRREGDASRDGRLQATSLWRPVAANFKRCVFQSAGGPALDFPVHFQPVDVNDYLRMLREHDGESAETANAFDVIDGVLWIRAGTFYLRKDSSDLTELNALLQALPGVRGVEAIVFDVRGNRGGDSGIGDRIFTAATGGIEFDEHSEGNVPRYFAKWRVSDQLVAYADHMVESSRRIYGADGPGTAEALAFRASALAAKKAGSTWLDQDAGLRITRDDFIARHGHLRRFDGKIVLLTDRNCVSACLDFADTVLQVAGALHMGETTGADSLYMPAARFELPSGNAMTLPLKVWRNRPRGNNEPYFPAISVDLSRDEATVRRIVIDAAREGNSGSPTASPR